MPPLHCVWPGRKPSMKGKPTTHAQGWSNTFRYDNIEAHMKVQHPTKWEEYRLMDKTRDNMAVEKFFETSVPFRNKITAHFASAGQVARNFVVRKDIIDTIVGKMMYFHFDAPEEEEGLLESNAEISFLQQIFELDDDKILCDRHDAAQKTEQKVMSLFKISEDGEFYSAETACFKKLPPQFYCRVCAYSACRQLGMYCESSAGFLGLFDGLGFCYS
eukprot:Sdes_comp20989_c0_seq2m19606